MNTLAHNGSRLTYTAPTGGKSSGNLVILRSGTSGNCGVCVTDIAAAAVGEVAISGVHTLTKEAGAISQYALVYRKASNGNITTATTGNTLAGYAAKAAISGATTVEVMLNGTPA